MTDQATPPIVCDMTDAPDTIGSAFPSRRRSRHGLLVGGE
jgi:hypothetical protein